MSQESRAITKMTTRCALYVSASHASSQSGIRVKLNSFFFVRYLVYQKLPHVPLDGLWAMKSEGAGLIVRAISFEDFQPMWSWSTNVTDRRTDNMQSQDRALHYSAPRGKMLTVITIKVSKMTSHCTCTVQMREESEIGIRKWEDMWIKTTAEDGERGQQWRVMEDCSTDERL